MATKTKKKSGSLKLILTLIALTGIVVGTLMMGQDYYMIKDFRLEAQKRNNWCWAAGAKMVLDYTKNYRDTIPQCEIVNQKFSNEASSDNACSCLCDAGCDNLEKNRRISDSTSYESIFNQHGLTSSLHNGVLGWNEIKQEIGANYPVLFHNLYRNGSDLTGIWSGYHVVVASGFIETQGIPGHRLLFVNDPWKKCKGCSYLMNYDNLETPHFDGDTVSIPNYVNGEEVTTIHHTQKINTNIFQRVYFQLQRLPIFLRSFFDQFNKPESQSFTNETMTIKNFLKGIPNPKDKTLQNMLGFNPESQKLKYYAPFSLKSFDKYKILYSKSTNLKELTIDENTIRVVNVQDENGSSSLIKLSQVSRGNGNFWIIDNISRCDFMTPLNSGSEVYSFTDEENHFTFERIKIKGQDFLMPTESYSFPYKTKPAHYAHLEIPEILEKGKPYSTEKIHYFLKTILNKN